MNLCESVKIIVIVNLLNITFNKKASNLEMNCATLRCALCLTE